MINPRIINTCTGIDVNNSKMLSINSKMAVGESRLARQTPSALLLVGQFKIEDIHEESHTQILNGGFIKKFIKIRVEDN